MSTLLVGGNNNNMNNNGGSRMLQRDTVVLPPIQGSHGNSITIKPDSPRTKEACLELGINPLGFHLKSLEEFGDDNCSKEIIQLRYNHYLERVQQDAREVQERRMQLIRQARLRFKSNLLQENTTAAGASQAGIPGNQITGEVAITANSRRSIIPPVQLQQDTFQKKFQQTSNASSNNLQLQSQQQSQFPMTKSLSESRLNPRQMKALYTKTVGYLKTSHHTAATQPGEEIIRFDENEGSELEYKLLTEIDKYNRLKEQKQKEAKIMYEEDIERLKTIERMKEKDMRLIEQTLKMKKQKDLKKEELKKAAEEKGQKVKQMEQKYNQQKREERERIRKKLEIIKDRQQKDNDERERLKKEQEEREHEKLQKMDQIRIQSREELIKNCDAQQEIIQQKLNQAQEIQKSILMSKVNEVREKLEDEQQKVLRLKDLRVSNEKAQLSRLVQKLVEREEHSKLLEAADIKEEMERKKALKAKAETTQSVKQKVKNEQNSKINELKSKFDKIEQNLQRKKQENEERIQLKQELRQLKELDKQENNQRKKRRDDYRLEKLMEKEKQHADKIAYLKEQQELLRKAKQEVSQQTKQETERIFDCVKKISNTLFPNMGANSKSSLYNIPQENKEKGVNLLKSIFRSDQLDMSIFEPPQKEEVVKKQP